MPRRFRPRARRRVDAPEPPEVERYFGPATIEVVTARGSWSPRVDGVGLGCGNAGCTLEVLIEDGEVRPTLPWWLRTTSPARVTIHGVTLTTSAPVVRRRGVRTVLRWTASADGLVAVLDRARGLPAMFAPLLEEPPSFEERAVLRDYALSTGDGLLARWLA